MLIVKAEPLYLYCDASRSGAEEYTVVAGAVSSAEKWRAFDVEWTTAIQDNELRYFRMMEFAQSVGQFENGWKEDEKRRRALLQRLVKIIVDHVDCWIGACVAKKVYEAADRVFQLHEYLQPYPLCGETCVDIAHTWRDIKRLDYLPMEYVFEDGDLYKGQLEQRVEERFGKRPLFRKKLGNPATRDEPFTPLQVGDFAAYELQKAYMLSDPETAGFFERFRTPLRMLSEIPSKWGDLTETGIRTELNLRGIPRR